MKPRAIQTGIDECNCMALRRAARRISQRYDEELAPAGLRATQFAMLALLEGAGALSVNELAAKLELDRTTTGKNLRPLERDGLVAASVAAEARRSRAISVTATGRPRFQAAYPLWQAAQRQFEGANGGRRMKQLRAKLNALKIEDGAGRAVS